MRTHTIIQLILWSTVAYAQNPKPSIRVRMNKGVFDQASTIVAGLVEYETPRVQIPNTQQCFAEGCVQIHSFRVTSFRHPQMVAFQPYPPNQFLLRITNLDFFVTGSLGGAITVIISIPVAGTVYVSGRGISISAYLDLQKNVDDKPYLRFLSCQIDGGVIDTRVANMGIFTDTVNTKYRGQMTAQTRQLLQEAICGNIHRLTQQHFSNRMAKFPNAVSAKTLVEMMLNTNGGDQILERAKRATTGEIILESFGSLGDFEEIPEAEEEVTEEEEEESSSRDSRDTPAESAESEEKEKEESAKEDVGGSSFNSSDISRFFNYNRLKHLFIDVNLLDASATYEDYSLGMSGKVFSTKQPGQSPYLPPFPFRLPRSSKQRMLEMAISQYSLNTMLYHAHRTNSLLFHVDSKTPKIGNLLKTTCSVDEVCLSDQIEEVGEKYPDSRLELIIRTTAPPVMNISRDTATMSFEGRCLFFLEGTRQKIGVIPFQSTMVMKLISQGSTLKGSMSITKMAFTDGLDFFGLTDSDLEGFRNSIKGTMENMINRAMGAGISLDSRNMRIPLKISSPMLSLEQGVVLLQANIDLYNTLYAQNSLFE